MASFSPKYSYVDTDQALSQCISTIKEVNEVALDIEGSSLHSYKDKVCLIQIATNREVFIIDSLAQIALDDLLEILKSKLLVLHGGDYDLRMLYMHYQFIPKGEVFDTMLAAELVGSEALSLAALIEQNFNVSISKSSQKSDWSKRPLSDKQLEYAAIDVLYLLELRLIFAKRLSDLERNEWHEEWCEKIVKNTRVQKEKEEAWRIKGAGLLSSKELNYLKHLWLWRDAKAEELDRPSFKVISNQFLLKFAQITAQCKDKILKNQFSFPKNVNEKFHTSIQEALVKASNIDRGAWPKKKMGVRVKEIYDKKRFANIKNHISTKAKELGLRPSLILSNNELTEFLKVQKTSGNNEAYKHVNLMKWQKALVKDILEQE